MNMETLLICLLLFYNAWLVHYILFGRRQRNDVPAEEQPPIKPPETADDIVGKSRFKIQPKVPQATIPEPQAATEVEDEDVTDIAVTFADGKDEEPAARIPDDELDEAFSDIRMDDIPVEYADGDEEGRIPAKRLATGASFEEIGEAVKIADNPKATKEQRRRAGEVFSEMKDNEFYNKLIANNPERAKKITGLMDEISGKTISGEGKAVGNVVRPQNISEVPADISGFDVRDFV